MNKPGKDRLIKTLALLWATWRPPTMGAETWQSLRMEAAAVMGEIKYQRGDYSGAQETFRDSLRSSTQLMNPQGPIVALDLYRSAELAARDHHYETAREHLEILLARYPDSPWTLRGQALLSLLPAAPEKASAPSSETSLAALPTPEPFLSRIQAAIKRGAEPYGKGLGTAEPSSSFRGGTEEALKLCREFAAAFPAHPAKDEVRVLAGALHLKLGRPEQAAKILEFAARQSRAPELRAKARYLLGASLFESGRYQDILEVVSETSGEPGYWAASALFWRAAAEERLGLSRAADLHYGRLLKGEASPAAKAYAWAAVARGWERRGDLSRARQALGRALQASKAAGLAELEAPLELGEAHLLYGEGRLSQAATLYLSFAEKYPTHPQACLALYQAGLSLKRQGRLPEAVAAFEALLSKNPDSAYAAEAHLQLGQIYAEERLPERAVAQYRRMGETGGKSGAKEALLLEAQVRYNRKEWLQAIPLYHRFLNENPADIRRKEVEELLLACYWQGDRDNPELFKMARLHPESPLAASASWEEAARAYRRGDWRGAARGWKAFLQRHPRHGLTHNAWQGLGQSLLRLGDKEGALAAYQALASKFPSSAGAAAWYQIGFLQESLGRKAQAHRAYQRLARSRPSRDGERLKGLMRLGLFYELESKSDKALRLYQEIARLSPEDSPLYQAAHRRVEKMAGP